jgi:hypothetical protein
MHQFMAQRHPQIVGVELRSRRQQDDGTTKPRDHGRGDLVGHPDRGEARQSDRARQG